MKKFINKILRNWYLKNFPLSVTTEVQYKIFVKKGKLREWRLYDENYNRIG